MANLSTKPLPHYPLNILQPEILTTATQHNPYVNAGLCRIESITSLNCLRLITGLTHIDINPHLRKALIVSAKNYHEIIRLQNYWIE